LCAAVHSLGVRLFEKRPRPLTGKPQSTLLAQAKGDAKPEDFRLYGSARTLLSFSCRQAAHTMRTLTPPRIFVPPPSSLFDPPRSSAAAATGIYDLRGRRHQRKSCPISPTLFLGGVGLSALSAGMPTARMRHRRHQSASRMPNNPLTENPHHTPT